MNPQDRAYNYTRSLSTDTKVVGYNLKTEQYLSTIIPKYVENLTAKGLSMWTAPAGAGKSFAILEYIYKAGKKQMFVVPTRALLADLAEKYKHYSDKIKFVRGKEAVREHDWDEYSLVTTYDSVQFAFMEKYSNLWVDEAHCIPAHSDFRNVVLTIANRHSNVCLVSATTEAISDLPLTYHLNVTQQQTWRDCNIYTYRDAKDKNGKLHLRKGKTKIRDIIQAIENSKKELPEDTQIIVSVLDKKLINELCEIYHHESIMKYVSYSNDVEELYSQLGGRVREEAKDLVNGKLSPNIKYLFTTSVMYAGVSLEVQNNVKQIMFAYEYMPHPLDAVQYANRIRYPKGSTIDYSTTLDIYGNFATDGLTVEHINYDSLTSTVQHNQIVSDTYCQLDQAEYTELLSKHYIRSEVHTTKVYDLEVEFLESKVRDPQLIGYLGQTGLSTELIELMKVAGYSTEAFMKRDKVYSNKFDERAKEIIKLLLEALDAGLDPNIFLGKRFNRKAINIIARARETAKSNVYCKNVIKSMFTSYESGKVEFLEPAQDLIVSCQKALDNLRTLMFKKFRENNDEVFRAKKEASWVLPIKNYLTRDRLNDLKIDLEPSDNGEPYG